MADDKKPKIDLKARLQRMGGPGHEGPDAGDEATIVLRRFAAQFDFDFRVPARLPDGYLLLRGQPLSESAVRLTYEAHGQQRHVYVKASPGHWPSRP